MIEVVRERHETPAWIQQPLSRAGGLNMYGQPRYRVVWGWNRLSWIGGRWSKFDANGNIVGEELAELYVPKYIAWDRQGSPTFNRWFIEKWCPAELYGSPWDWRRVTASDPEEGYLPQLGPYPSRGEYELSQILETPKHDFLQVTPVVAEYLSRVIEYSFSLPRSKRAAALVRKHERQFDSEVNRNIDILSDVSPFFKGSYASYAGINIPDSRSKYVN